MTRILLAGAAGVTVVAGLFVFVLVSGGISRINDWQSWIFIGSLVLGVAALDAAVWFRLFRRRTALRNFDDSRLNPFTPRSKYAVWGHVPRSVRPRTRKRLRPASAPPKDF